MKKENLELVKWVTNKIELDAYESIFMYHSVLMNNMPAPIVSNLFGLLRRPITHNPTQRIDVSSHE